jgi:uncharacterized protein YjbJ (UPF0337 family)
MNWNEIDGNWKQIKGELKEIWGKLTANELTVIAGQQDQRAGTRQRGYGYAQGQSGRRTQRVSTGAHSGDHFKILPTASITIWPVNTRPS